MKKKKCKIPGYQNLWAKRVGGGKYIIEERGKHTRKIATWTRPITREEAKKLDFDIPKSCR